MIMHIIVKNPMPSSITILYSRIETQQEGEGNKEEGGGKEREKCKMLIRITNLLKSWLRKTGYQKSEAKGRGLLTESLKL